MGYEITEVMKSLMVWKKMIREGFSSFSHSVRTGFHEMPLADSRFKIKRREWFFIFSCHGTVAAVSAATPTLQRFEKAHRDKRILDKELNCTSVKYKQTWLSSIYER